MKKITLLLSIFLLTFTLNGQVILSESFDDIATLTTWNIVNVSTTPGTTTWFQGNDTVFPSQAGAPTAYIGANFNSTTGTNTISNWLIMPVLSLNDGNVLEFYTRTVTASTFPDRLEVRMSPAGPGSVDPTNDTDVGSYTTLLLEINPSLNVGGYPETWEIQSINISGLGAPTNVRIAFRYFVTNGGPTGSNSNFIGIDEVNIYTSLSVDEFELNKITHFFNNETRTLSLEAQVILNEIAVYNILGQETLKVKLNNSSSNINLSSLQSGVYIAKISGENASKL